jgi:transcriptional activator of cad operon
MIAIVSPWTDQAVALAGASHSEEPLLTKTVDTIESRQGFKIGLILAIGAALCIAAIAIIPFHRKLEISHSSAQAAVAEQPQQSVAVLPFLDLTAGMKEGEFADGMTEELIDRLSKVPRLQVPAPTSSFYFKDKQIPVADIAKALRVLYVVDGSVRKSGARVRVAARLIRVSSGYVIWSETYDRPFRDRLIVQDDIASEVTKALKMTITAKP